MPRLKNKGFETFNDGILNVYTKKDRKVLEVKLSNIRFGKKVIGAKKYYDFKVIDEKLEKVIVVPNISISQKDIVEIEGVKYQISLIQEKFDNKPPHLLLHLKKGAIKYGSHTDREA